MTARKIRVNYVPRKFDERTLKILRMWARGFSNTEISRRLGITSGAVSNQITAIRDADTTEGDQSWAYRRGCAL